MPATYDSIASYTLGSNASSYTFSSIPSTYTDLIIVSSTKLTSSGADNGIAVRYNGDSGSNYSMTYILGNGSSASSGRTSNQTSAQVANVTGDQFYPAIIQIQNYSNTTTNKTAISRTSNASYYVFAFASLWRSTAAINSIELIAMGGNTFISGSTFTLFGIKSA